MIEEAPLCRRAMAERMPGWLMRVLPRLSEMSGDINVLAPRIDGPLNATSVKR